MLTKFWICEIKPTNCFFAQAFGYKFDNDDYHRYHIFPFFLFCFFISKEALKSDVMLSVINSYVHGRLPYQNLKPDPVLRTLLHSLPIRKVVRLLVLSTYMTLHGFHKHFCINICLCTSQIFSNANEAHVAEVLNRLGLEDCFDDVICFESLNPTNEITNPDASKSCVIEYDSESADGLRESPIVCKPFENAFQQAFQMANINPHKTVSYLWWKPQDEIFTGHNKCLVNLTKSFSFEFWHFRYFLMTVYAIYRLRNWLASPPCW